MKYAELNNFKDLLKSNGNSITAQRLRLFASLHENTALSMKELISSVPSYDQVTVYRNVALFEKLGVINRLRLGWETKLELSDSFQQHHHHLSCTACGEVWTLREDTILENKINSVARLQGFKMVEHELEIRGVCVACQNT